MASSTKQKPPGPRQRKPHRKSRLGCSNCKLRSIKCDESRPSCARCRAAGFACTYAPGTTAPLQLVVAGASHLRLSPRPALQVPLVLPVARQPGACHELRPVDRAALQRFWTRTVLTVGAGETRHLYRYAASELSASNPFLLHVFLAVTLLHDSYLAPTPLPPTHRATQAFHWYHAVALFKQRLLVASASPAAVSGRERDALWTAATLLGAGAFAVDLDGDTRDRDGVWPLATAPGVDDLAWLKMSDGKKVVWTLLDAAARPESLWHAVPLLLARHALPLGHRPIPPSALPRAFYPLLGLGAASSPATNPYHVAASVLAQLLPRPPSMLASLSFISQLDAAYRRRLEERDAPALLLLAWWYAQLCGHAAWWVERRALVEGRAICVYLERVWAGDEDKLELLEFPRQKFELVREQAGIGIKGHVDVPPSAAYLGSRVAG